MQQVFFAGRVVGNREALGQLQEQHFGPFISS